MEKIEIFDLSWLWDLMDKDMVGFITAYKGYRSSKGNQDFNAEVEAKIRDYRFGFVPIDGECINEQTDGIGKSLLW